MLRAIIGTVAVLAGFGVLERTVDASTGYAGSCISTQAYALLQRGGMVSVRAEPTPQAADLLMVDGRVEGTITAYDRPGLLGSAVATIEGDDMKFRVLACRGSLLQVVNARHGNVWIDKGCAREEGGRG